MEFKEIIKTTLKDKMPQNPQLSALTGRIILTLKEYNDLQIDFVHSDYNMWCTGINKKINPDSDPDLPFLNYIDDGDAKNFSELFITEHEAESEANQAAAQEEKTDEVKVF